MFKTKIPILILLAYCFSGFAQQNIGVNTLTPDTSAVLDIVAIGKGILIPRTDTATVNASNPAKGLMIFDNTTSSFWYYDGNVWAEFFSSAQLSYKYPDRDGDGEGDPFGALFSPSLPQGYVLNSLDCDDNNPEVNTSAPEICNGIDDDCDGTPDNGNLCGLVPNANSVFCNGTSGCAIGSCSSGYYDFDGIYENGCECTQIDFNSNSFCMSAITVPLNPGTTIYSGQLVPEGDEDWIKVTTDTFPCVTFQFNTNPDGLYAMDIYYDCSMTGCPVATAVKTSVKVANGASTDYFIRVYSPTNVYSCDEYVLSITQSTN